MQIIMLNGGLGNQLFQYIFARYIEKISADKCCIDDSAFWGNNVEHNGYEVDKIFLGNHLPKLSEYFSSDVWNEMLKNMDDGITIPSQLLNAGLDITFIKEYGSGNTNFTGVEEIFDETMLNYHKNNYFYGYWLNSKYLAAIKSAIKNEFQFRLANMAKNEDIINKIKTSKNSVAIHIRRGDMVKLGWVASAQYFKEAIDKLKNMVFADTYFLFSDDINWCKVNARKLGLLDILDRLTIVDWNKNGNAYMDMYLMSLCCHRISDRSSFSLLAGLLCDYPYKIDINNWKNR